MRCPFCGTDDTKVIDSRLASEGHAVRRRRECVACSERFTTFEHAELALPAIIKSGGRREAFDEQKLRGGMLKALEKRPVASEQLEESVTRLKHRLRACGEREVSSRTLGDWVMEELRALDEVAYVRFASVYLRFQDVNAFREEIERLQNSPAPEFVAQQIPLLPGKHGKRGSDTR